MFEDPDDAKLLTLARGARARGRAAEGAALRDDMGRTYAAATVSLPSLQLSAISVAVAMAIASGSSGAEAVVVFTDADDISDADRQVLREFAGGAVALFVGDRRV